MISLTKNIYNRLIHKDNDYYKNHTLYIKDGSIHFKKRSEFRHAFKIKYH